MSKVKKALAGHKILFAAVLALTIFGATIVPYQKESRCGCNERLCCIEHILEFGGEIGERFLQPRVVSD